MERRIESGRPPFSSTPTPQHHAQECPGLPGQVLHPQYAIAGRAWGQATEGADFVCVRERHRGGGQGAGKAGRRARLSHLVSPSSFLTSPRPPCPSRSGYQTHAPLAATGGGRPGSGPGRSPRPGGQASGDVGGAGPKRRRRVWRTPRRASSCLASSCSLTSGKVTLGCGCVRSKTTPEGPLGVGG